MSKKRKKNRGPTQPKKTVEVVPYRTMPHIIGGEFNEGANDIDIYQKMIDNAPKLDRKIRVLFDTEASYLRTGFSTYLHEVFTRLHKTGRFELAELACYGAPQNADPRAAKVPWKYYHNLPTNPIEEQEYGTRNGQPVNDNYRENQFGKWKLSYALADFKPDAIILNRDHWMDSYVLKNPLAKNCLIYWMPTVDGYPQKWEWLKDYAQLDGLFAYSWFGKKVLEEQSRTNLAIHFHKMPGLIVKDVCQSGADLEIFKPLDKEEIKKAFGVPSEIRFIGTVMRNQPRKLFPRIIDAFYIFKTRYPHESRNVKLLLHTSVPDVGWDIAEAIMRKGMENEVLFTYICRNCNNVSIMPFRGSPTICPTCNKQSLFTPNTQFGVAPEQLAIVYNLLDVYIQGSIAEGCCLPVTEAKACGVPCLVSDYSALYEKARNGGAMPISSDTIYTEHETMQWRDLFSKKDLAYKLSLLMGDEHRRLKLSREARACAEKYYGWDLTAKKWEAWICTAPLKDRKTTWDRVIELKTPIATSPSADLSDEDFIEWCYKNILCRKGVDAGGMQHWTRVMQQGATRKTLEQYFRKMIDEENKAFNMMQNPKQADPNPITRIADIIEKTEKK